MGTYEVWRSHTFLGGSAACPVAPEFEKARGGEKSQKKGALYNNKMLCIQYNYNQKLRYNKSINCKNLAVSSIA